MKIILLVLFILSTFVFTFAQEKEVKETEVVKVVLDSFYVKYPDVKTTNWIQGADNYEVSFIKNQITFEANYSLNGNWIETGTAISEKDIPEIVLNSFKKSKFGKWKIEKTDKVETPEYSLLYMFEVIKGKKSYELYFSAEGKLIKKE